MRRAWFVLAGLAMASAAGAQPGPPPLTLAPVSPRFHPPAPRAPAARAPTAPATAPKPAPPAPPPLNIAPVTPDYYPPAARAAGVEGEATVSCEHTPQMALTGCRLVSETPAGQGFGAAALAMAAAARPNPKLAVTDPAMLERHDVTVRFRLHPPSVSPNLALMWHVVVPAKIIAPPTAADWEAAWPAAARQAHADGFASMSCRVTVEGRLTGCVLLEEHPLKQGFGATALALAAHFTLSPRTLDGEPVEEPDGRLPIHFSQPPRPPLAPDVQRATDELDRAVAAIRAFYPNDARAKGLEGAATLSCQRSAHGALTGCFILSETPPDAGFGAAAMAIALRTKDDPWVDVPRGFILTTHPIVFSFRLKPTLSIEPNLMLPSVVQPSEWFGPADAGNDLSRYYPHRAQRLGVAGRAVLDCRTFPDGHMDDCAVASETPPDQGFGRAAVLMARKFKAKAGTEGRFIFPIDFAPPK